MTEMASAYEQMDRVEHAAERGLGYNFGLELAAAAYHGHPAEAQGRAIVLCCNHLLDGLHAGEMLTIRLRGGDRFAWQLLGVEAAQVGREPLQARVAAALRLLPELRWANVEASSRQHAPGYALVPEACALIEQRARVGFAASSAEDSAPELLALMPALSGSELLVPLCDHGAALPPEVWLSFEFRRQPLDAERDRRLAGLIDALCSDHVRRRGAQASGKIPTEILPAQAQRWLALCQEARAHGALTSLQVRASGAPLSSAELGQLGCLAWPDRAVVGSSGRAPRGQALDLGAVVDARALMRLWPSTAQLRALAFAPAFRAPLQAPSTQGTEIGHASGKAVALGAADMARHLHVLGATGAGKSTLLERLAATDIAAGRGVCVLDPHGDLYTVLLDRIPAARREDLVLVDLCDAGQVPGLNFLQPNKRSDRLTSQQTTNELLSIFERMYDMRAAGGPVFEQYLRHAVHLLTDSRIPGLTLCEIPVLFEDASLRRVLINHCTNRQTVSFWNEIAEKATGEHSVRNVASYVTSKLNQFTHHAVVRAMVGQSESTLDFRRFMDEGKIVLIRLPKGILGEKALELLGLLIVGRIQLAALGRADIPRTARRPFHLYIDECQNFVSGSVAAGLGEARKYGLHFILAHQHMAQLDGAPGHGNLKQAILGNVANRLMFRLGVEDADKLACYAAPEFTAADLQYLPDFRAVARILRDGQPLRPFALAVAPLPPSQDALPEDVLMSMRARHAKPIDEVEAEIAGRLALLPQKVTSSMPPFPFLRSPVPVEEKA